MKSFVVLSVLTVSILSGCHSSNENEIQGYIEGDFVRVSLPESGIIETLTVSRGETVQTGKILFTLDAGREQAALEKAKSELTVAENELENLKASERSEEIKALEADVQELKANLAYTSKDYHRQYNLSKTGAVSLNDVDKVYSEKLALEAKIRATESRLKLARLSIGRDEEILSAQHTIKVREASVRQAQADLALRTAIAPENAVVTDIIFRPGETVPGGQAVVELLPSQNIKARFYLSPQQISLLQTKSGIALRCEGSEKEIPAKISYISPEASYRPPVLYSRDQSEKLAFLVEAVPLEHSTPLHPGQPVTVVFSK